MNYLPRFGDSTLKFASLADNKCDELNLHPCFAGMKPAKFSVSTTAGGAINGFSTEFQERLDEEVSTSWNCTYGIFDSPAYTYVELTPKFGALVASLTFNMDTNARIAGITIKMDSGETLSAGNPNAGGETKEYMFDTSSNLFLSVGGTPSIGW